MALKNFNFFVSYWYINNDLFQNPSELICRYMTTGRFTHTLILIDTFFVFLILNNRCYIELSIGERNAAYPRTQLLTDPIMEHKKLLQYPFYAQLSIRV